MKMSKILPWVIFSLVLVLAWMTLGGSSGYDIAGAPLPPGAPTVAATVDASMAAGAPPQAAPAGASPSVPVVATAAVPVSPPPVPVSPPPMMSGPPPMMSGPPPPMMSGPPPMMSGPPSVMAGPGDAPMGGPRPDGAPPPKYPYSYKGDAKRVCIDLE